MDEVNSLKEIALLGVYQHIVPALTPLPKESSAGDEEKKIKLLSAAAEKSACDNPEMVCDINQP
jgi:hypothetical protein